MAVETDNYESNASLSHANDITTTHNNKKLIRKERNVLKKTANRARHRLLSIQYDVDTFVRPTLFSEKSLKSLPILANERCGSWYVGGLSQSQQPLSCYFKSTDGHVGVYNFSLKRLNLHVISTCVENNACIIVDSSVKKPMPDSFSRTIPIWCVVMNKISAIYRSELGIPSNNNIDWDDGLYTPDWIVSQQEHAVMESLIDTRVQELYDCKAIVDPTWLATTLNKPLRPYWISPSCNNLNEMDTEKYFAIVCLNASQCVPEKLYMDTFWYTAGAADDEQEWARGLTPQIFWNHREQVLGDEMDNDDTDKAIDVLVKQYRDECNDNGDQTLDDSSLYDLIGNDLNTAIGTRRAGRPSECWKHFDAILNVTDTEYDTIHDECTSNPNKFYLQLPVKEGKRDKMELERWMAVGIVFCVVHAQQNRQVLIHCAQGKDRSVAVAMAVIVLFCHLQFPLKWKDDFWKLSVEDLVTKESTGAEKQEEPLYYKSSGLSERLVKSLQGRRGRDCLLEWVRKGTNSDEDDEMPLATKETLRRTLHLIRQDRAKAEPTRSTMQKLNRFFMSGTYDKE